MFEGSRVVVVVPARDEARYIGAVIRTMPAWVDTIVVVDDGSTDGTAAVARATGDGRVVLLVHGQSRGVGAAIAAGYRHALQEGGGPRDVFAVMAGDGQMQPDDLAAVVAPLARGLADYAKGNRLAAGDAARVMPRGRYVGVRIFSKLTSWAVGHAVADSQCGYTAITRQACGALDLDDLWPSFGYPNDLLGQLAVRRARVVDVPVRPLYATEESHLRLWHVPAIVGLVARARLRRALAPKP